MLDFLEKTVNACFACLPRKKPSLDLIKQTKLIAHRGVVQPKSIENTLEAFKLAKHYGCWGVELDVQTTADGVLVVNHDPCLNRLWGVSLSIASLPFEELRRLAPLVPTLAEVIESFVPDLHLFIELKAPFQHEAALVKVLEPLTPCVDYHLLSLDEDIFSSLSAFPLESLLLVPVHNNTSHFFKLSLKKHYGGVLAHYILLSDAQIKKLKEANQAVGLGFVNSKFSLYREISRNPSWIFSNNIPKIYSYLKA